MKIRLTDRVCILNFKNDFEKKLMNKFLTYKDTSKCFIGGKHFDVSLYVKNLFINF